MTKKKYWFLFTGIILLIVVSYIIGLSTQDEASFDRNTNTTSSFSSHSPQQTTEKQSNTEQVLNNKQTGQQQQIVYEADIEYQVKDMDKASQQLAKLASKHQAMLIKSDDSQDSDEREVLLRYRVPHANFQAFVDQTKTIASVISEIQIGTNDVSEELVDLQARIKAKQALQTRLLALTNRATTTEEVLDIEETLDDVQTELERLTGRQQYLQHHVAFSTVTFSLQSSTLQLPSTQFSLLDEALQQFLLSCKTLWIGLQLGFVWLAAALPYILIIAIITSIIVIVIRRQKRV